MAGTTAKMTVICVLVACLFPGAGYDTVLATAFGLPGLELRPGAEVPSGSAFSQARKLLGEQAVKRIFELDAAGADADLGIGLLWKGLEVTAIDGTTMQLARNDALEGEFGTPADGARPVLRVAAHVRIAAFRWIGAAIGSYHDGENALADQLENSFRPGVLSLADRGFFSMDRFLRFSARGADLAWRIKNGAKSVPLRTTSAADLILRPTPMPYRAITPLPVNPISAAIAPATRFDTGCGCASRVTASNAASAEDAAITRTISTPAASSARPYPGRGLLAGRGDLLDSFVEDPPSALVFAGEHGACC